MVNTQRLTETLISASFRIFQLFIVLPATILLFFFYLFYFSGTEPIKSADSIMAFAQESLSSAKPGYILVKTCAPKTSDQQSTKNIPTAVKCNPITSEITLEAFANEISKAFSNAYTFLIVISLGVLVTMYPNRSLFGLPIKPVETNLATVVTTKIVSKEAPAEKTLSKEEIIRYWATLFIGIACLVVLGFHIYGMYKTGCI